MQMQMQMQMQMACDEDPYGILKATAAADRPKNVQARPGARLAPRPGAAGHAFGPDPKVTSPTLFGGDVIVGAVHGLLAVEWGVAAWALTLAVLSLGVAVGSLAMTTVLWRLSGPRLVCTAESQVVELAPGSTRVRVPQVNLTFPSVGSLKPGDVADIANTDTDLQPSLKANSIEPAELPDLTRIRVTISNGGRFPKSIHEVALGLAPDSFEEVAYITKNPERSLASLRDVTVDPAQPPLVGEVFVLPLTRHRQRFRPFATFTGRRGRPTRATSFRVTLRSKS